MGKVKLFASGLGCEIELDKIQAKLMLAMCKRKVWGELPTTLESGFDEVERTWHRFEHEAKQLISRMESEGLKIIEV